MGDSQSSLKYYLIEFKYFENFVNRINSEPLNEKQVYIGYFVNKNDYENFYNIVMERCKVQERQPVAQNMDNYDMSQVTDEIKKNRIQTFNKEEIYNQVSLGKEFILINEELYEKICFKNIANKVYYQIIPNYLLILVPGVSEQIFTRFKNNKNNIINIFSINTNNNKIVPTQPAVTVPNRNNEYGYNSEILKHLIRFLFFKNKLIHNPKKNMVSVYLIKCEVIKKFKEQYKLREIIFKLLEDNKILEQLNYQNCNMNYPKISKLLNTNNIDYINSIKSYETQILNNFNSNESFIIQKKLNNNPRLIYYDNFEVIF